MSSQTYSPGPQVSRPLPPPPPDWQSPSPPPPQPRKRRGTKALAVIIVLLLLLSILLYTPLGNEFFSRFAGRSFPQSSSFTLTRQINIGISLGEISYVCEIPYPEDVSYSGDVAQDISVTEMDPTGIVIQRDGSGWIQWTGTDDQDVSFSITYEATVNTMVWDISSKTSGMASDVPTSLHDAQTGNEWEVLDDDGDPTGEYHIWPTHPTIRQLSEDLTSDDRTVYENVRYIYGFIRENIDYRTVSGSEAKTCLQTLADGNGDCDDQSILLISLCRSIGIPSWLAFGLLYDNARDIWGPHAWAEVYIPLKDTGGEDVTIDPANGEFLVRNCNRLEEWKSDGIGDHLSDYYNLLSYNYTVSGIHQQPPLVSLGEEYSGDYQASSERVYASMMAERYLGICMVPQPQGGISPKTI